MLLHRSLDCGSTRDAGMPNALEAAAASAASEVGDGGSASPALSSAAGLACDSASPALSSAAGIAIKPRRRVKTVLELKNGTGGGAAAASSASGATPLPRMPTRFTSSTKALMNVIDTDLTKRKKRPKSILMHLKKTSSSNIVNADVQQPAMAVPIPVKIMHCSGQVLNLVIVTAYVIGGALVFMLTQTRPCDDVADDAASGEDLTSDGAAVEPCMMRWTFIDAIYFAMTTISTVGYGDLSVALDSGWMVTFTVLYIMGGFVIAFPRLTAAVTFVIQPFFDVMAEAIERTFPQRAIDIDGNGDYDYKIPRHPLIYYSKGLLGPLITFVLVQCLFSALFIWIEPDWDHYGIAYYHCMVTASTVGYGDLTIVTQRGKLLAFFHIFVSVSLLAAMLSDLDGLRTRRASELRRGQQFLGRLNVDNIMSLDTDGTGVDMFEFVVGMLLKLDYVNCETVQGFVAQFQALDTSGDGILQRNELERYVALQRDIIRKCSSLDHRQIERLGGLLDEKERDEAARSNLSEALGRTVLNHTGRSRSVFSSSSRQPSIPESFPSFLSTASSTTVQHEHA